MAKQELINLTDLRKFTEEFDKVESYVDSYLKTQLPNNYDDLKKHINDLRKMLIQLEDNRADGLKHLKVLGDSDEIPKKKSKLLRQIHLSKIKELRGEIQTKLDDYIAKQGKILAFITTEYLKSNHQTDEWKFPTSLGIEQIVDEAFETFVKNKIFKIDDMNTSLSTINEKYDAVRKEVLPIIKKRMLTYMGNVINDIGRDGAKVLTKSYVKKEGFNKPKKETQEIYDKIRKHYFKLEKRGKYTAKYIRKTLAEKYGFSEAYIKDIMYK